MLEKLGYFAAGIKFTSIAVSIAACYPEKTDDDIENAHAERTGIFIGLWPQTFFTLAMILFKLKEMGYDKNAERIIKRMEKKVNDTVTKQNRSLFYLISDSIRDFFMVFIFRIFILHGRFSFYIFAHPIRKLTHFLR